MAKFEMDTDFIRKLAAILEETNLGEIEMADGERKIRVARPAVAAAAAIHDGRARWRLRPARAGCPPPPRPPAAAISASIPAP